MSVLDKALIAGIAVRDMWRWRKYVNRVELDIFQKTFLNQRCGMLRNGQKSASSDSGFDDWKHAAIRVGEHEQSPEHTRSMLLWCKRRQDGRRIDTSLEIELQQEQQYWQNDVLKCVVQVIEFLVERGLAFRGANETLGSPHNGTFLGILELLSQFDPFLSDHLARFGNTGSGISSYLSSSICEELIGLMGNKVKSAVIQ